MRSRDITPIYPLDLYPEYESCQREMAILALHLAVPDLDEAVRRLGYCHDELQQLRTKIHQLQDAIQRRHEHLQAEWDKRDARS